MKAAGIVAEYNPLHNGHIYHVGQTREATGADAVVVAMSGDHVQRGEPAILDKWTRAGHALSCGADLVVEIPVLYTLGNAGQYASAAVKILESTGMLTHLSFGSECGDTEMLSAIAQVLDEHAAEIDTAAAGYMKRGLSYPAARTLAYSEIRGHMKGTDPSSDAGIRRETEVLASPNDILAIEYIRSLDTARPVAVRRAGAGYSDPYNDGNVYQSASALREEILGGKDISKFVPACCNDSLISGHITGPDTDAWWRALRYAVMSLPAEWIEDCPSGGEGLANLLKSAACGSEAHSWSSFISSIKSKRYTYTRISRLCMQVLLGITRSDYAGIEPGYIRVLGFNDTGRRLLAKIRDSESASLPVITNINKEADDLSEDAKRLLALDVHAADIYNLLTGREVSSESDHRHAPVIAR